MVVLLFWIPTHNRQSARTALLPLGPPDQSRLPLQAIFELTRQALWASPVFLKSQLPLTSKPQEPMVALLIWPTRYSWSACFPPAITTTLLLSQFFLPSQFPQNTIFNRLLPIKLPLTSSPKYPMVDLPIRPTHYYWYDCFALYLTATILPS